MKSLSERERRITLEAALLRREYAVEVDDLNFRWIRICDVETPVFFDDRNIDVLLDIPPGYPMIPPPDFYLPLGLTVGGRPLEEMNPHYHPEGRYRHKGWASYCLLFESWSPRAGLWNGDSLITVVDIVKGILERTMEGDRYE